MPRLSVAAWLSRGQLRSGLLQLGSPVAAVGHRAVHHARAWARPAWHL